MSDTVMELSQDKFETHVSGAEPVVVDFWAPWCGPCRSLSPVIEELAGEYQGRVRFAKVNIDDNRELAQRLGIRAIPTVVFYKDGQVALQFTGAKPKNSIVQDLEQVLAA